MYIREYTTNRPAPVATHDVGLGSNLWVKIREKVVKPVGRLVAAYYTAGSSELAYKAYKDKDAANKAAAARKSAEAAAVAYNAPTASSMPATAFASMQASGAFPPIPPQARQPQTPEWVVPVAVGAGALLLVAVLTRR